jgi:hypothetical protein
MVRLLNSNAPYHCVLLSDRLCLFQKGYKVIGLLASTQLMEVAIALVS